jgi:phosphatidylglycerophosphate synthase
MNRTRSIKATYKGKDTEEFLDIIFYRPLGYAMALASKALGLTPNTVTIISIFVGVAAGHFFYYSNLSLNLFGIFLLIVAQAMDSADGQLARITNSKSRTGRILDGFGGNLWFFSIYLHLLIRMVNSGYSPYLFFLILAAGISHSFQSAYADYFRNFYLMFAHGKNKSEIDESAKLTEEYKSINLLKNFSQKFLMRIYLNYTIQQELFSKNIIKLFRFVKDNFKESIPVQLSDAYRTLNKPLIKYFNILTTNTRMIVLFAALLIKQPILYFLFELTLLNILFIYVVLKHEKNSTSLYNMAIRLLPDRKQSN